MYLLHLLLDLGELRDGAGQSLVVLVLADDGQRAADVTGADGQALAVVRQRLSREVKLLELLVQILDVAGLLLEPGEQRSKLKIILSVADFNKLGQA